MDFIKQPIEGAIFIGKVVIRMQIQDLLSNDQLKKLQSINKSSKPKRDEQLKPIMLREKLSTNEWKNIMGVHRDIYTRRNGAVRRK